MLKGSTWHHTEARRMKIRNLLPIRKKTFVVNKFVPLMMTISSVAIYFKSNRVYKWEQMNRIFNNLIAMIIWDNTQLQTIRVQYTEVICRVRFSREPPLPFNFIDLPQDWINSFYESTYTYLPLSSHQKWLLKQIKLKPKYWGFNRYPANCHFLRQFDKRWAVVWSSSLNYN